MDENNDLKEIKNTPSQKDSGKKSAKDTGDKKGFAVKKFFTDIFSEFKKIIWPNRSELIKKTTTVIITSGIFGAVIVGYDTIFGVAYRFLLGLI